MKHKSFSLTSLKRSLSNIQNFKEGENKIVIGMPTLAAWGAAMGITNKIQLAKMDGLDEEITAILKSFGGVEVPNGNPLTRK